MDYLQATKASGNGGFEMLVFAPASVQEAADMTYSAFDYADRDRNPVLILCDGLIGAIMEPVELPAMKTDGEVAGIKASKRPWACVGHGADYEKRSWIEPGHWSTAVQQKANEEAAALYESWRKNDARAEEYMTEDAEIVLTAYGAAGRLAKSVVDEFRASGRRVGLIRPITAHPFPNGSFEKLDPQKVRAVLDMEMSIPALMAQDVSAALEGRIPVHTCLCSGGNIMKKGQVLEATAELLGVKPILAC
jgi:2-oxoglutarate ferredoxin oxidoreductase subunit alpha